jgi:hypothetical protein
VLSLVFAVALASGPVNVGVEDATQQGHAATGRFSLTVTSIGRPFTFNPRALHFSWHAEGPHGGVITTTPIPAAIRTGAWAQANLYPSYTDTSPDRYIARAYRAELDFGAPPGAPGLYELMVSADPGFAHTDRGVALALSRNDVVEAYWPDERHGDPALADLRRRIFGRSVYAFGGSLVACADSNKTESFDTPLHVTRVTRDVEGAYWLTTGATGNSYPNAFLAIDPIEVNIDGCAPGLRFADPWQAGVSITTQAPPPNLHYTAAIVPGMSRSTVLWLLGYPNAFGTAEYFNRLEDWDYWWPQGLSKSVTFAHDSVVDYTSK